MTRKSKRRTQADGRAKGAAVSSAGALLAREAEPLLRSWIAKGRNVFVDGPEGCGRRALAKEFCRLEKRWFVVVHARPLRRAGELLDVPAVLHGSEEPTTVTLRAVLQGPTEIPFAIYLDALHHAPESVRLDVLTLLDSASPLPDPRSTDGVPLPSNAQFLVPINNARPPIGSLPVVADPFPSFAVVKVHYPEEEEERAVCQALFPTLDAELVAHVVRAANAVRTDQVLDRDLPHGAVRDACELLLERPGEEALAEVLRGVYCARFAGRIEDEDSEARAAWESIASALPS